MTDEEGRSWLERLRPAVVMRAELVVSDRTEARQWRGWVAAWNDMVAEAFDPRPATRPGCEEVPGGIRRRDADSVGLSLLIVICVAFTGAGIALTALSDGALDMRALWEWWDSAAGRFTTAITGIGGLLGISAYVRNRAAAK